MTTGKLNCVSKQHRPSHAKTRREFPLRWHDSAAVLFFLSSSPPKKHNLCPVLMFEARQTQSDVLDGGWRVKEGLGIGCCARDRSCVIHVTQLILARLRETSWPRRSPLKGRRGWEELTSFMREGEAETEARTVAGW